MKNFFLLKINFFEFLLLLASFIYGNLFVIDNSTVTWTLLLIFCIVFFLEFINKLIYFLHPENIFGNKTNVSEKYLLFTKREFWSQGRFETSFLINIFKRGFLLGFFVEAFKVGS